jgi:hypothetical protein
VRVRRGLRSCSMHSLLPRPFHGQANRQAAFKRPMVDVFRSIREQHESE